MRVEDGLLRNFFPTVRVSPAYRMPGTFARRHRARSAHDAGALGNICGERCRPLLIDPADSLSIDSRADWESAERRLAER
jgi:hypothetical protein